MTRPLSFSPTTISELRQCSADTRVSAITNGKRVKARDKRVFELDADLRGEIAGEECARIAAEGVRR